MDTPMEAEYKKLGLRQEMKRLRGALDAGARALASEKIAQRLLESGLCGPGKYVLGYCSAGSEVETGGVIAALRDQGCEVLLPRMERERALSTRLFRSGDALIRGSYGIEEPSKHALQLPPQKIDVVLLPGLAFDRKGRRLGYGAGYYDRFLPRLRKDCVKIGLCFALQIFDEIPHEPHDVQVDYLVDENRIISCGQDEEEING